MGNLKIGLRTGIKVVTKDVCIRRTMGEMCRCSAARSIHQYRGSRRNMGREGPAHLTAQNFVISANVCKAQLSILLKIESCAKYVDNSCAVLYHCPIRLAKMDENSGHFANQIFRPSCKRLQNDWNEPLFGLADTPARPQIKKGEN